MKLNLDIFAQRGATVVMMAAITLLLLIFLMVVTIVNPKTIFDGGAAQGFWVGVFGWASGSLATALSNTKNNGGAKDPPDLPEGQSRTTLIEDVHSDPPPPSGDKP